MIRRKRDWPQRLDIEVLAAAGRPFAWGQHDCSLFAGSCVAAMTGADPMARFRGHYTSKRGAYALAKRFAGGGVAALWQALAAEYGWPEIAPLRASGGDVAVVALEDVGDVLAVVALDGRAVLIAAPDGLTTRPLKAVARAWRVG